MGQAEPDGALLPHMQFVGSGTYTTPEQALPLTKKSFLAGARHAEEMA